MEKKLEAMMTSKESFWPDEQILTQSVCEGQEGPFAKHGKDLSSVFVSVSVPRWICIGFVPAQGAAMYRICIRFV